MGHFSMKILCPSGSLLNANQHHVPFLFAVLAGGAVFAAVVLLLQPRKPFEDIDAGQIGLGQLKAAQAIMAQAYQDMDAIGTAAQLITDKTVREMLQHLVAQARDVALDVEKTPSRLGGVRRLLTYYLPRTLDIATNYAEIAAKSAIPRDQQTRVQTMLQQLDTTYRHYREQSVAGESDALDVELDLLARSIKQDLEKS